MVYSTESAKWKAYQFSDPFAAGAFYVCNKISKSFCRPDCDAKPITNLKSEIKFVDLSADALAYGYNACAHCDPLNLPVVDVNLLIRCVTTINKQIGFLLPLLDENEDNNNEKIKENIITSKKNELMLRRSLVPVVGYDGKYSKDFDNTLVSKNDSDHYKLVDLACRHLALAAAVNIFQLLLPKMPSSSEESSSGAESPGGKKRRRRGGVLGFKELAAKSKLLAWHFHRVFKSVTGLTPKTYGDKCSEFLKSAYTSGKTLSVAVPGEQADLSNASSAYETPISNMTESDSRSLSPATSTITTPGSGSVHALTDATYPNSCKRVRILPEMPHPEPQQRAPRPTFKEGLLLSQPYNNLILLTQLSSLNVLTPPIVSPEQTQMAFDFGLQLHPSAHISATNSTQSAMATNTYSTEYDLDDALMNSYVNTFQPTSDLQAGELIMDVPHFSVTNPLFAAPDMSSYGAMISDDPNPKTNLFFDSGDLGAQFMSTGYSDETQMPLEDIPADLAQELSLNNTL